MLSENQQRVLQAVLDRIIPPDDFPGAWEAGVGDYIARQWEGDFQPLQETYRAGLDALDAEATAQFGLGFADLGPEQGDALLRRVEAGTVQTIWTVPPQRFFAMLVHHAAEGYYADPGQGSNHGAVSWKMIGFEVTS